MIDIVRVRNLLALDLPDVQALTDDAFKNVTCKTARSYLPESIADDHVGLFLARDDTSWRGLVWLRQPVRDDDATALVLHFYCRRAGKGVREALIKTCVDFAREGGATTLMAWDLNRKPRAFQTLFRDAGPSKEVIRAYEFDLKGARV